MSKQNTDDRSPDQRASAADKISLATVWLDGCSGCHMSFLDMDERLLALAEKVDLVYSPLVDRKEYPEDVDVVLVEGAVSSTDDLERIRTVRARSRTLVSLGDCAVTANVPAMRNPFEVEAVLRRAYDETAQRNPGAPDSVIPKLLPHARPIHEYVHVDIFVPGCPPHRDVIYYVVSELIAGRQPKPETVTRFGQ